MISEPSSAFLGAFLGAALGLPAGFLAIEVLKLLASLRERRRGPEDERLAYALTLPGVRVFNSTQVANNWIRTYDLTGARELTPEGVELPAVIEGLGPYLVHVAGPAELPARSAAGPREANELHREAVRAVRRKIGLPVPPAP